MNRNIIYTIIIFIVIFTSCSPEPERQQKIVVEGWISENEPPVVFLHHSMTFNEEGDSIEAIIAEKIIKWANVTIDDGNKQIKLLAQMDQSLVPPVKYSTSDMVGEVGRTYNICVDYNDEHVSSQTTLLTKVDIDSIVSKTISDNKLNVQIYFADYANSQTNHYLLMYKYLKDKQYLACPMGVCDNSFKSENGTIKIDAYRRTTSLVSDSVSSLHFEIGDSIMFKLCHIDEPSYRVWSSFSSQQISPNIPITAVSNIDTNISGGLGYWCGLNGTARFVILKEGTIYPIE